ncbi:MAG: hypothetical protein ACFFAH_12870 [Promethearchaeota archaeon]
MNLKIFDDWPSPKATKGLIIIGFFTLIINYPFLLYTFYISNYPVTFLESQLSFSGAVIKSHFKGMNAKQLNYYRLNQLSDDVYDFCYITMFFGLTLFLARKFDEDTVERKSGFIIAIVGIIGAICDVIENSFIIMMTTDPQGFPDSWAVIHSCLAAIKFTLWGIQAVWIIWAGIKLLDKDIISTKVLYYALGVIFAQHWPTILTAIGLALRSLG